MPRLQQAMRRVIRCMNKYGLALATENSEIVLLIRRRTPREIEMTVDAKIISTKISVPRLDRKTFWEQIQSSRDKAAKVTTTLRRLMASVGGLTVRKVRKWWPSLIPYNCIWKSDLIRMASIPWRVALRIASSYCMVSKPVVLVITKVTLIDLLAQERKGVYEIRGGIGARQGTTDAKALTQ